MTNFLWLCHSSGGNLPPSLGVARELTSRGHKIAFVGRPEMAERVEGEGLRAIVLDGIYDAFERFPESPMSRTASALTSAHVADDILSVIEREKPDMLIVDAMFPAALVAATRSDLPSAMFCHTFFFRQQAEWQDVFNKIGGLHAAAGFEPWPERETLWKSQDRIIVTSSAELDDAALPGWPHVSHVGPVLDNETVAKPIDLPWADDDEHPLVLLSLSTTELASKERFQTALDALGDLPINVVATSSAMIDPSEIVAPANAYVVRYAAHDPILEKASMVVTHGGHGTMMRALRHGVPMAIIPGMPHDQVPNGQLIEKHGAGVLLPGDAGQDAIRTAVSQILGSPGYRVAARALSEIVKPLDGARAAADIVEEISTAPALATT